MNLFPRRRGKSYSEKSPYIPEHAEWAKRAIPSEYIASEYGLQGRSRREVKRLTKQVRTENTAYLERKKRLQHGVITGYVAVNRVFAEQIVAAGGLQNAVKTPETDLEAWDFEAAEQVEHAIDRASGMAGNEYEPRILCVSMRNPRPVDDGRLRWQAEVEQTDVIGIYTPEEFRQDYAAVRAFLGRRAIGGEETLD